MGRLGDVIRRSRAARGPNDASSLHLDPAGKKVLLVYLFTGLGDAVLLAPVVAALRARGAKVGVLVRPLGARALGLLDPKLRRHVFGPPLREVARAIDRA